MRFRIVQQKRKGGKHYYYVQKFFGIWRIGFWYYQSTGLHREGSLFFTELDLAKEYIEEEMDTQKLVWKKVLETCERALV